MAIRHKRTTTTNYTWQAGDTVDGQIGLNLTDGTLHFKKSNGSYVKVGDTTGFGSGTVTDVAALTISTTGTNITSTVANGTTTPVITLNIPNASASNRGALTSTDWSTFNNKQATLVSGTNIRTVNSTSILGSGNLSVGTVTSVSGAGSVAGLSLSGTVTGSGNITLGGTLSVASVSGTLSLANGGTGQTSAPLARFALQGYNALNVNTTLTSTSSYLQHIYGGAPLTITLPNTNTMNIGQGFLFNNTSGGNVTINTSTAAQVTVIPTGMAMEIWANSTNANNAGNWTVAVEAFNNYTGTGSVVLAASPTITGSAVIGGTTLPSATGTTGQVLALSSAGTAAWTTASGGGAQYALVTGATTFFTGTKYVNWTTENHDPNGLVTLSNGTFTLGTAGTYLIQWITTHSLGDPNNWRLFNQTSSTTVATFTMTTPPAGSAYFGGFSAVVAITGSTVFRWDNPNTGSTSILNTPQMLITKIA